MSFSDETKVMGLGGGGSDIETHRGLILPAAGSRVSVPRVDCLASVKVHQTIDIPNASSSPVKAISPREQSVLCAVG